MRTGAAAAAALDAAVCDALGIDAKRAIVFAPGKYIGQRELTAQRITFCQIPYEMRNAASAL